MTSSFIEDSNNDGGLLTIGNGTVLAQVTLLGQFSTQNFSVASAFDGHGGTLVTDPPAGAAVTTSAAPPAAVVSEAVAAATVMTDPGPFALFAPHP